MQHYYTKNSNLKSDKKIIEAYINNQKYKFITDIGVFSKKSIDFGTKTMLESFYTNKKQAKVCDLGCGYGVVSTYLAKNFSDFSFLMIDVNNRALELSKENISLNNIKNEILIKENNALDKIYEKFDIILTNPPIRAGKKVVVKMLEQSYGSLLDEGELWVVVQKKQGMDSYKKIMYSLFENVEIVLKNKGYYVLKSIKNN